LKEIGIKKEMASFFRSFNSISTKYSNKLKSSVNVDSSSKNDLNDETHTLCDTNEILQPLQEKSEYGSVSMSVSTWNKRAILNSYVITPKGSIIHGANYNPENMRTGTDKLCRLFQMII
jgi:hypothetical protein